MLKLWIAALCCGITFPALSHANRAYLSYARLSPAEELEQVFELLEEDEWSLGAITSGYIYLQTHQFNEALESFRRASVAIEKSGKAAPEYALAIDFGKAIAYDNLGLNNLCKQAIGSLFLNLRLSPPEQEVEELQKGGLGLFIPLAPSPDVRDVLYFIQAILTD